MYSLDDLIILTFNKSRNINGVWIIIYNNGIENLSESNINPETIM